MSAFGLVCHKKNGKRNLGMKKNARDLWESCNCPKITRDDDVT